MLIEVLGSVAQLSAPSILKYNILPNKEYDKRLGYLSLISLVTNLLNFLVTHNLTGMHACHRFWLPIIGVILRKMLFKHMHV